MSRYLLDTSIISNVTKTAPSKSLLAWMAEQVDEDLFIASLTIAEIRRGVLEKPAGRKRDQLEAWFAGPEGPSALFAFNIYVSLALIGFLVWALLRRRRLALPLLAAFSLFHLIDGAIIAFWTKAVIHLMTLILMAWIVYERRLRLAPTSGVER